MSERPIIFSTPMVRAILDGRKTQTRRVVKHEWNAGFKASESYPYRRKALHRARGRDDFVTFSEPYTERMGEPVWFYSWGNSRWLRCPYGAPGDTLWVRETWTEEMSGGHSTGRILYRADQAAPSSVDWDGGWRPSIHMPRLHARLFLRVESVRVERVQDIPNEDYAAEGIAGPETDTFAKGVVISWSPTRRRFIELWDSYNARRGHGWDTNCWVWVVTFSRVES